MAKYRRYFVREEDSVIVWARRSTTGYWMYKSFYTGPFKTKTKAVKYVQSKSGGGGNTESV